MPRIAVVQKPPKFLDREKTILEAVSLIGEAVSSGASLVIFPEAYIPGYPAWIWRLRPGSDYVLSGDLHALLLRNSVTLDGEDLRPLREAARQHRVTVVCGMDERDHELSRGTIYNTVAVIGPDGEILNRHRKLMPTNPERMVWGVGDASGLKVVETPCGRIGTLICWENYMPLSRYALYAQGVEVYIAPTYDYGDGWIGTLQHIAREGRCWVVGSGTVLRGRDIPEVFPSKNSLYPDPEEWINPGDSVVIKPGGKIVSGPMRNEEGILYGEIDSASVAASRRTLDVAGHYARPDVFQLHVNRKPLKPVTFEFE
jgi:nitrilase